MAALPDLVTVEQFRQMPDGGEFVYELHHGEVVAMTRPRPRHWRLQKRLYGLLELKLKAFGEVVIEAPFRAVPEFDLRAADVAVISRERWDAMDLDDDLRGAPELVIEVLSPSNTPRQLRELAAHCLVNGAVEFWIVDPAKLTVTVVTREGGAVAYAPGASVPLARFGAGDLSVDQIFA
jgi:Uma2 family endonuclease